ncbi:MAG: peptide ABC transporter substrate-binding protein [Planctomycetota bacterium]|jgi:oligopeptide transport system substrate-binding protein
MKYACLFLALALFVPAGLAGDEADPFSDAWKRAHEPEDDAWKSVPQELIFNNNAEPETLDPAIMTGVTEHTLALALYEGLASHDPETLGPRPGVAARWEISADGKVYTFHLRKNAKWSNGDPVTAEDFRWSWFRALNDPLCDYAYLFFYIQGAEAFREATLASFKKTEKFLDYAAFTKMAKLEILDPHKLRITLRAPTAFFLDLCCFETYMPVHRGTIEKHGKDRWTRPENWVGNGPFSLKEWSPRQHIIMVPEPNYWDADFVKLRKITALPVQDIDVAYNKFVNGEAHWIRTVPTSKIDDAKRRPEYFVAPYLGSYFYRINVTRPPLDDKHVRQALSLAVNRETITRDVLRAGQVPATWFCPPIASAGYEPPRGWAYDPDRARKLLAGAGYPDGKGFPKLTLFYNTQEDHKRVAERIAQMWRETLGINISLQNAEWQVYLNQVEQKDYDIARAGWIGDYGDPMTFLDMWVTGRGNNNTGWSNARYDELIAKANTEPDAKKRIGILREAERIVTEDEFPIIPIYIYVNQGMKVDGLQGWYETVRDLHPFKYMYFEPE